MRYVLNLKLVDGHKYSTELNEQEIGYLAADAKANGIELNGYPVKLSTLMKLWDRNQVNAIETAVLVQYEC